MSTDTLPAANTDGAALPHMPEDGLADSKPEVTQVVAAATPTRPGRDAWLVLVGSWLLLFTTFGYTNAFGVYQDLLTTSKTSTPSNISWIGSTQLFFFNAMALPAGRLLDKGYFRQTMVIGSVLYVFSLFMVSLAHVSSYYQMYLSLGIGMGLGSGLLYVPAVAIQAHYWKERRALAMGAVITGSSVGGIIYPILLNQLYFDRQIGFGPSVRATAYLTLGLLALANGLMLLGLSTSNAKRSAPPPRAFSLKDVLTDATYIVSVAGFFLVFWGLFFPYFYLQLFTISHGLDATFGFYTVRPALSSRHPLRLLLPSQLAILNASSVFGRTIPNMLADYFGPMNALTAVSFGAGILILGLFGVSTVAGVAVFAVLYGFFSGAVLSLVSPTLASLSPHPSQIGVRLGLAFFIGSVCNLTGTPIDGALLTAGPYYWYRPIIFSATVILVGAFVIGLGRTMNARRRDTPWV
ncbi:major facilitator superfamily domain-containing protein [Fomitopsis serialis]|uniref:major facilitator superfamily domain-containing protein n=1 Tax=Fomitopsis serialis TaxID=139415 RepID=UPI0020073E0F|nr:major facilitator superfamily domain-containing protein [Neoantrodia serialis]KAH9918663.1 major facilitator superfamily domain-containing protein [Neoantrodia serialis]